MKSDKIKLIVAVAIFAIAAVVIAYQLNLFGGSSSPPPVQAKDPNAQPRGGPRAVPTK